MITLEHILPREPKLSDWPKFTKDTIPLYRSRLGNQTLLLKSENKKLANECFAKKIGSYKKSKVKITNSLSKLNEWSPANIEASQKSLAKLACQAWPNSI